MRAIAKAVASADPFAKGRVTGEFRGTLSKSILEDPPACLQLVVMGKDSLEEPPRLVAIEGAAFFTLGVLDLPMQYSRTRGEL